MRFFSHCVENRRHEVISIKNRFQNKIPVSRDKCMLTRLHVCGSDVESGMGVLVCAPCQMIGSLSSLGHSGTWKKRAQPSSVGQDQVPSAG